MVVVVTIIFNCADALKKVLMMDSHIEILFKQVCAHNERLHSVVEILFLLFIPINELNCSIILELVENCKILGSYNVASLKIFCPDDLYRLRSVEMIINKLQVAGFIFSK